MLLEAMFWLFSVLLFYIPSLPLSLLNRIRRPLCLKPSIAAEEDYEVVLSRAAYIS